jgi:NADH-quinone oxidoreductase subunit L
MQGDPGKGRFFGGLSIFMFSMLGIVLADNLLMVFVFWELVGFSSYMLIGHYLNDEASAAARKAFVTNRVGDFGFLIGIILLYWQFGTVDLVALEAAGTEASMWVGLALFCGVLGKSAQMPLHVWLPDAMAGPTPISALIHAATMVAAGVFLLARTYFLFDAGALEVIAWVGTVTAVCAAFWAFAQRDIKKILAYSTLSQLGFMVAAFGFGTLYGRSQAGGDDAEFAALWGVGAAMFHLTTHAFFKALLFLGSGSVIHACHHEQDIFRMGGLLRKMPVTGITFLLGVIAIAGVPFVAAGFFSKDVILLLAKGENTVAFGLLTFTALLTAIYMGRLFVVAFLGKPNSEHAAHAHESSWTLWLPLVVLAVFSTGAVWGLKLLPGSILPLFDDYIYYSEADHGLMILISALASIIGLGVAWAFYGAGASEDRLEKKARPLWALSRSRFGFDELYRAWIDKVQQRFADVLDFFDALFIGGLAVRGTAGITGLFGLAARAFHTGNVGSYAWWFFVGVVLVWGFATGLFASIL